MVFNGHSVESVDALDEDVFADICVMFSDGLLGGKGMFDSMAPITAAIFNYLRPAQASAVRSADIFPWVEEYEKNPDLEPDVADKISNNLLAFMTQAPGFKMGMVDGS